MPSDIAAEFQECRRVGTPIILVQTPDYRSAIETLKEVRTPKEREGEITPPAVIWDYARGHKPLNNKSQEAVLALGTPQQFDSPAPVLAAANSDRFPERSMLFVIVPQTKLLEEAGMIQAIANLRDPFKGTRRTLILVGDQGLKAPPFLSGDIPTLREELPDKNDVMELMNTLLTETFKVPKVETDANYMLAADLSLGLAKFTIEENLSRNYRKGRFDTDKLRIAQRQMVESMTNRALTFDRDTTSTFDNIGGLAQWKKFATMVFKGNKPPRLVWRLDEIDKALGGATGAVQDNTGISQEMLQELLTAMEDNGWKGCLFVGGPGSGKTLATVCTGNTFDVRTVVGNLAATKDSLAGSSGKNIRTVTQVMKAIGGRDVFVLATCNRIESLPPELIRRFNRGTYYFSKPTDEEKMQILELQCKKFSIPQKKYDLKMPGWVGSDIRNCVELAADTGVSLKDASQMISLAGRSAAKDIAKLEQQAEESGWLSANYAGTFTPKGAASRQVEMN